MLRQKNLLISLLDQKAPFTPDGNLCHQNDTGETISLKSDNIQE